MFFQTLYQTVATLPGQKHLFCREADCRLLVNLEKFAIIVGKKIQDQQFSSQWFIAGLCVQLKNNIQAGEKSDKKRDELCKYKSLILSFLCSTELECDEPGVQRQKGAPFNTRAGHGGSGWGQNGEDVRGLPEELYLGWRLRMCVGGVRLGATGTQAWAGRVFSFHNDVIWPQMRT